MFETGKLLKVVSIIFIVFMGIGIVGTGITIVSLPMILSSVEGLGIEGVENAYSMPNLIMGLVATVFGLATGIMGLLGKSKKLCYGMMGIYIVYMIYGIITAMMTTSFGIFAVLDLILPILYLWGVYQSEEREI